jgi:hypothetical protein
MRNVTENCGRVVRALLQSGDPWSGNRMSHLFSRFFQSVHTKAGTVPNNYATTISFLISSNTLVLQRGGLGVGLTTLHHKNKLVTKNLTEPRTWADSLDKRQARLV